jgi:hypothetical protein
MTHVMRFDAGENIGARVDAMVARILAENGAR